MVFSAAPAARETFSRLRRTVELSRGPLNADVIHKYANRQSLHCSKRFASPTRRRSV